MSAAVVRGPSGILLVDKPVGPTSHDVVGWVRRALGTKTVGHAGTLDPFASGVLVVLVGEATKLSGYATAEAKTYATTLALGQETTTLDREGEVTEASPVPAFDRGEVEAAIATLRAQPLQVPPRISAIKKDGVRHYERARRGEEIEPEAREVVLYEATLDGITPTSIRVTLRTGKGYYVRSFGRDLARLLGTHGHLTDLRRIQSGRYRIEDALDGEVIRRARGGDLSAQAEVRARLKPITRTSAPLPVLDIDGALAALLRVGKKPEASLCPDLGEGPHLAFEGETPVAIVERRDGVLRVLRGIVSDAAGSHTET